MREVKFRGPVEVMDPGAEMEEREGARERRSGVQGEVGAEEREKRIDATARVESSVFVLESWEGRKVEGEDEGKGVGWEGKGRYRLIVSPCAFLGESIRR